MVRKSLSAILVSLTVFSVAKANLQEAIVHTKNSPTETEQRIREVCSKASQTIVFGTYRYGQNRLNFSLGIIASAEGHLLMGGPVPNGDIEVRLADGSVVVAETINWSTEHGYGWAKLKSNGRWPHVSIPNGASPTVGQPLVVFGYPVNESDQKVIDGPLASLEIVNRTASQKWFMSNASVLRWYTRPVAFDLDGNFSGMAISASGKRGANWIFVDAVEIASVINSIKDGDNVDLEPIKTSEPNASPAKISVETKRRATAASVRIRRKTPLEKIEQNQMKVSGTVISQDGLIATCGHHFFEPGTEVTVSFSDGRSFDGEVVGFQFPVDIGLVQLNAKGPFQHVELGDTTGVRLGDSCFAIGYGGLDLSIHHPNLREALIVERSKQSTPYELASNSKLVGGDSGGGLFDHQGKLLGIHIRNPDNYAVHSRVELFSTYSENLRAPFQQQKKSHSAKIEQSLLAASKKHLDSVVQILDEKNVVAVGTAIASQGLIVTKASTLPTTPRCRLPNGNVVTCKVLKRVRQHDIAVLQIEQNLPFIKLAESGNSEVGALVSAATGDDLPAIGCLPFGKRSFAPESGYLRVNLKNGKQGVEVGKVAEFSRFDAMQKLASNVLRKGDVLVSLEGQPITTKQACLDLLAPSASGPGLTSGDSVRIEIIREGKAKTVSQVLAPSRFPHPEGQSFRSTGFKQVSSVMVHSKSALCGGPVIDKSGQLLGIGIAWHRPGWLLVLPSNVLREVVGSLAETSTD